MTISGRVRPGRVDGVDWGRSSASGIHPNPKMSRLECRSENKVLAHQPACLPASACLCFLLLSSTSLLLPPQQPFLPSSIPPSFRSFGHYTRGPFAPSPPSHLRQAFSARHGASLRGFTTGKYTWEDEVPCHLCHGRAGRPPRSHTRRGSDGEGRDGLGGEEGRQVREQGVEEGKEGREVRGGIVGSLPGSTW